MTQSIVKALQILGIFNIKEPSVCRNTNTNVAVVIVSHCDIVHHISLRADARSIRGRKVNNERKIMSLIIYP